MIKDKIERELTEDYYSEDKKKVLEKRIIVAILAVIFIVLMMLQGRVSAYDFEKDLSIYTFFKSFQGVISVVQIIVAVVMVTVSKEGYTTAVFLFAINTVIITIKTINTRDLGSMPGLAMAVAGAIIIFIIHNYIEKLFAKEKQLYDLAHKDVLTDLPNRRALKQKIINAAVDADTKGSRFAMIIIDLDNFKNVNDTLGHDWGDKVLSGISERWRHITTERDFFARLGGDEFALVIEDYDSLEDLDNHLKDILNSVRDKFVLKGKDYYISASIGVALYPSDTDDTSQLLKYSDMAMYAAKYQGKKRICYFDSMMNDVIESSVEIESIIRRAVTTDMFTLVFQPQFTADKKSLRGFETLIRLSDDKGKQVSPGEFIPVAEKSSLIIDVDKWVLRSALKQFKPVVREYPGLVLSINISAIHMLEKNFLNDIDEILAETKYPVKNLELELTESVFVDSLDKAKEIMKKIKDRGIKIALDDFGTGYSSLSYLKELPIDLLKIDKAFVDTITDGPKEESFVEAIISLGKVMQFEVISEGVENQEQLDILKKLGCDYIQGFLWGKPLKYEEALRIL